MWLLPSCGSWWSGPLQIQAISYRNMLPIEDHTSNVCIDVILVSVCNSRVMVFLLEHTERCFHLLADIVLLKETEIWLRARTDNVC